MAEALYKKLPDTPGVYLMKNSKGRILYIGKAGNLRRRVSSYFQKAHDYRIEKLVSEIRKIDHRKTDSALEAFSPGPGSTSTCSTFPSFTIMA